MKTFLTYLLESKDSDTFEQDVAKAMSIYFEKIQSNFAAIWEPHSTSYSDVEVTGGKQKIWIECKMNHTDNLYNKRFMFDGAHGGWKPMTPHLVGDLICDELNKNSEAQEFIDELAKFLGIPVEKIFLPSSAKSVPTGAVDLNKLNAFVAQRIKNGKNRNIAVLKDLDVVDLVLKHYTEGGKTEDAQYLQTGDDFYIFGKSNPLNFKNVPTVLESHPIPLTPIFRLSTRSHGYELMTTLKLKSITSSPYSFKLGTKKSQPKI